MLILKGFLIGLGKIIPGVSGALIAISFGVYEKAIGCLNNLFKKENFFFLFKLGIGVLLSIILTSNLIVYLLNSYYLIIMLLFIGLIVGGLFGVKKCINKLNYLVFIISFVFVFLLKLVSSQLFYIEGNNLFFNIFLGFIDALCMIIPGISGTAVMMVLGVYDKYILLLSSFDILSLLPFIVSMGVSILLLSKLVYILFNKYKDITYSMVLGFSVFSIIYLLINCLQKTSSFIELVIGIILFILGFFVSFLLGE